MRRRKNSRKAEAEAGFALPLRRRRARAGREGERLPAGAATASRRSRSRSRSCISEAWAFLSWHVWPESNDHRRKEIESLAEQYPLVIPAYFGLIVRAFRQAL